MVSLEIFIKKCEQELLIRRELSKETLLLAHNLSDRNKTLCKPILDFIERMRKPMNIEIDKKVFDFLPEERILICRLIPLTMSLDTSNAAWSSYMLTKAIQAATSINGIKLSEIGIAFLEIFYEFKTPLNRFVYNFCIDLPREFTVNYKKRFNELEILSSWEKTSCHSIESVAFLRYCLASNNQPEFLLKTMITLIQNEHFKEFISMTKWLFDDLKYKQTFLKYLFNAKLSKVDEDLILSSINHE